MRLRTVIACLAVFCACALIGALTLPGSTFALWSDQAAWKEPAQFQPNSLSATTGSLDKSLLVPAPGTPQELSMSKNPDGTWSKTSATPAPGVNSAYKDYEYVGSQFHWDEQEAARQIVEQIEQDESRSRRWYGVSAVAELSAESHGALSWGVLVQWEPNQDINRASLWDKSWNMVFSVGLPSQCAITDDLAEAMMNTGTSAYKDRFYEGPRFAPGMAESSTQGSRFICVVQVYVPTRFSQTATVIAPDGEHADDTWSATFYDLQPELDLKPRLGLFITPIDPLNGPVRDAGEGDPAYGRMTD